VSRKGVFGTQEIRANLPLTGGALRARQVQSGHPSRWGALTPGAGLLAMLAH